MKQTNIQKVNQVVLRPREHTPSKLYLINVFDTVDYVLSQSFPSWIQIARAFANVKTVLEVTKSITYVHNDLNKI